MRKDLPLTGGEKTFFEMLLHLKREDLEWLMIMPNGLLTHKMIRETLTVVDYIDILRTQAIPMEIFTIKMIMQDEK